MPIKNRTAGISRVIYEGQRPSHHMYAKNTASKYNLPQKAAERCGVTTSTANIPPIYRGDICSAQSNFLIFLHSLIY